MGFFEVVPEPLLVPFDFRVRGALCGSYTGGKTEEDEEQIEDDNIYGDLQEYTTQELA